MEYIQEGKFIDKIQIKYGLVLEIHKYKSIGTWISSLKCDKTNSKIAEKGVRQSTVEIYDSWYKQTYPIGTYFIGNTPVKIVEPNEYRYEIRCSGGTIVGDFGGINKILDDIKSAINKVGE